MAFKADCASSTVLEALSVARTAGFLVPGECRSTIRSESGCHAPPVNAGRFPRRFRKSEIRNPKLPSGRVCYTVRDEWAFIS